MERKTRELLPMQVFPAQVKEVAEEERTCTVRVNDNVDFFDVRLYAVTDKSLKGFCLIPAIDSTVLVARIANANDLYVCSFSEVDKVLGTIGKHTNLLVEDEHLLLKTENVTVDVSGDKVEVNADKEDGIIINGGKNNGLVKIKELTDKINALVDTFNTHTHTIETITSDVSVASTTFKGSGTASGVKVPQPDNSATSFNQSHYEDTKVKH